MQIEVDRQIHPCKVVAFGTDAWVHAYRQHTAAFPGLPTQMVLMSSVWAYPRRNVRTTPGSLSLTASSTRSSAKWWNPQFLMVDDSGQYREFFTTADR